MASSFSPNLKFELIGAGEQSGAWNNTTNTNIGTLIEQAICGVQDITLTAADYTLETADGASSEARNMVLILGGSPGASRNIIAPDVDKVYIVKNDTAFSHTIKTTSGTGVSVAANSSAIVFCDSAGNGTFYNAVEDLAAGATINGVEIATISGTQTLTNKTLTAPKFADGGFIADPSGNELLKFVAPGSAANEISIANAPASSSPTISSTGSDSDIGLNLTPKGSGAVTVTGRQVINSTDNTNAALRITQTGTGNALLVEDDTNPDSTPFVINNAGRAVIGYTTTVAPLSGTPAGLGVHGDGSATNTLSVFRWSNDTVGGILSASKSRGASAGTQTIVSSGDNIGTVLFTASDGTNFITAARIDAQVDGTPGTSDMPGRITFSTTADGASSATERFRIGSAGQLGIAGANYGTSGQVLTSGGSSAAPSWATLSASGVPDVIIEDQKTSGTAGGSATTGAWTKRDLNTLVRNNNSIATLSSSEFTLPAGTYYLTAQSPFFYMRGINRLRLFNVTDNSETKLGRNAWSDGNSGPDRENLFDASLNAVFTISGTKTLRIEYYVASTSGGTSSLGVASSLGTEIYTTVNIWKL